MGILKMAWRNIWRNRRRTIVTVAAMTLALFVMVIYTGLMQGLLDDMERSVVEVEIGDLQIHAVDYLDDPSIYALVEGADALLPLLEAAGFRASPRLVGGGLIAARDSSAGVSLRGVEVQADRAVSEIEQHVAEGEWLDPSDLHGVVLGRRLARLLDVRVGDELVALSQATDGSMANDLYAVRGILESISEATDRGAVFLNAAAFREFFVLPEGVHEIIVRRPEGVELQVAADTLRTLAPGLDTKSWRDLLPTLATMMDSARVAVQVVFVIVYVVIAILILNAMLMAVFERIREFGILKALGVGPGTVMWLIFVECGLQTGARPADRLDAQRSGAVVPGPERHRHGRVGRDLHDGCVDHVCVVCAGDAQHVRGAERDSARPRTRGRDVPGAQGRSDQPRGGDAASVSEAGRQVL